MDNKMNKWTFILLTLACLFFVTSLSSFILSHLSNEIGTDQIVVIPLYGEITTEQAGFGGSGNVIPDEVIPQLQQADQDPNVKAIVLEINSPGGSAVASAEIAQAVEHLNKTTYAVIREMGASGAYWIASSTDKIIASPMSITGSIGVISSYLDFSELFQKYGVTYDRLVAGNYKDIGSPYKTLTKEEQGILQEKLDKIHKIFIDQVLSKRNIKKQDIATISTGTFFLGTEAKDLGLVDELATKQDAYTLIKQELNLPNAVFVEKRVPTSLFSNLAKQFPVYFGKGFAAELLDRGYSLDNSLHIQA